MDQETICPVVVLTSKVPVRVPLSLQTALLKVHVPVAARTGVGDGVGVTVGVGVSVGVGVTVGVGVFVGVAVGSGVAVAVGVAVGVGVGGFVISTDPASHATPCGRAVPRWSVATVHAKP